MIPIQPTDLIILAIRVVVSSLTTAELIARNKHGRSLRQQQGGQHISNLPPTQLNNLRIIGGPFSAAIPGAIVGIAVTVILAIRFIVLFVIADQIAKSETVMRGYKVHRRPSHSSLMIDVVSSPINTRFHNLPVML